MDFWDLMRLLVRRWMISVPALLVSLGLVFLPMSTARPDYIATSYLQLVAPTVQPSGTGQSVAQQRNPWLNQDLSTLGDAAIVTLQDQSVVDAFDAAGLSDSFTLQMGSGGLMVEAYQTGKTIPMVTVEVVAKSREQADATARELITRFDASLVTLQTAYGVSTADLITTHRLDLGNNIQQSTANVKRATGALLAVAVLATIVITVGVDVVLRRRQARRSVAISGLATLRS